jgi:hypothetical protein
MRAGLSKVGITGETRNRRSVWEVATQPFSDAHFATFPPALIDPCIKAGCPANVCVKCGTPVSQERINAVRVPEVRNNIHGSSITRRPETILQQTMFVRSETEGFSNRDVSGVWQDVSAESPEPTSQILQQGVRIAAHGEDAPNNERTLRHVKGLCGDLSAEPSEYIQRGLYDGTSIDDGGADRPIPDVERNSPSPGWQSPEQCVEQLGSDVQGCARPASKGKNGRRAMSALRANDPPFPTCTTCGADLTQIGAIGAGTVLDCFAGAGTTGLVADRLGRNAILIELNPDYVAMIERRIGDDAGMFADVRSNLVNGLPPHG